MGEESGRTGPQPPGSSAPGTEAPPPPRPGRLIAFYALLAIVTAAVAAVVITQGEDKQAQPSIAGGYDVVGENACLGGVPPPQQGRPLPDTAPPQPQAAGPSFDLKQSGQFVNVSNTQGTLGGQLRLEDGRGQGRPAPPPRRRGLREWTTRGARGHRHPRSEGQDRGHARRPAPERGPEARPPDPGAPKPRVPDSVAGPYKLSPRSTCFGGTFELEEKGSRLRRERARAGARGALLRRDEGRPGGRRGVHARGQRQVQGPGGGPRDQQRAGDTARRGQARGAARRGADEAQLTTPSGCRPAASA